MNGGLFTQEELETLVVATIRGHGGEATREQLDAVAAWAEGVRVEAMLLGLVLAEGCMVKMEDGEAWVEVPGDE